MLRLFKTCRSRRSRHVSHDMSCPESYRVVRSRSRLGRSRPESSIVVGIVRIHLKSLGLFRSCPESKASGVGICRSQPKSTVESKACIRSARAKRMPKKHEMKCLITSASHRTAPVNFDRLLVTSDRLWTILNDSNSSRLRMTPTLDDFNYGRLRQLCTIPCDSKQRRMTPNNSERLWMTPDESDDSVRLRTTSTRTTTLLTPYDSDSGWN